MDLNKIKSSLQMTNFYFSEMKITRESIIKDGDIDIDISKNINKNTIAIMFPFIRSQVTLLTSQPNMCPVILPTINTSNL